MASAILFLIIGLAFGGALGYVLKNTDSKLQRRNDELKKQLDEKDADIAVYKQDVANHFLKTADLVNNMTDSYRQVHEHLAQGANALCSEQLGVQQLDIRQTTLLDKAEETATNEAADKPQDEQTSVEAAPGDENATPEVEAASGDENATPEPELGPESVVVQTKPKAETDKQTVH
jgi:uncharacterized membrane-anchored protein YhcB (DUF1043 family)